MNWRAWVWGAIVALMTGSIIGVSAWGQYPNSTGIQLFQVVYPAIAGVFLAWLKQNPLPGSDIPPVK